MTTEKKYKGIIVPAVTPLTEDFLLDEASVERLFRLFYAHHISPFILGTTGESASLSLQFRQAYVKKAGKIKQPGTMLYAGISSNNLPESIEFARFCFDHGVDAVAATLPSYYTLTEDQMRTYFLQLAERIAGPLIIYNIPATTHMSIPLSLIDELSRHVHIVATKDSERSDERLQQSLQLWRDRPDFGHFLGWAARSAAALEGGSDGLIPSTGNLVPGIYETMWNAVRHGDHRTATEMQALSDAYGNVYQGGRTLGESLWALKKLMQEEGICQPYMMPPLQPQSAEEERKLKEAYKHVNPKINSQ